MALNLETQQRQTMKYQAPYSMKKMLRIGLFLLSFLAFNSSMAQILISGTIMTAEDEPLENVVVTISGDILETVYTNAAGYYEFSVPAGGTYMVEAFCNSDPLNGVSTLDAVLLGLYLEGQDVLDSPYKILAADVNNSGSVSTIDLVTINQLINGVIEEFPSTPSWEFVLADFVFPDPNDPQSTAVPSIVSLNGSMEDVTDVNFIGIKMGDLNCTAFTNLNIAPCDYTCGYIMGNVYNDVDLSCSYGASDLPLQNWIVAASSGSQVYYGVTGTNGTYSIPVFPGDYTISLQAPNNLWLPCVNDIDISIVESTTEMVDFFAQGIIECPGMTVDIGTSIIRRCFDGFYYIEYCNQGTVEAEDVSIVAEFDPFINVFASSIPWVSQNGNTFTFELDDLAVNECGVIAVEYEVSCDAELGQTLCSQASVFPDTICIPLSQDWDGASLELDAWCTGDSVYFEITNAGETMAQPVHYLVIEDDMIMMTDEPVQLSTQGTQTVVLPANGSTWRMELEQPVDHPYTTLISASIEGCGENSLGEISTGFITQFPQLAPGPTVDIDCGVVVGSYDPNNKNANPAGVGDEHYIEQGTELEYLIRFQNTGTDTAFTVIIKDTLSAHLNTGSIRPGVSSHPYHFSLEDGNTVQFIFTNIMLPDSNVNEAASHGFVKFTIEQNHNLALGTEIENRAAIYFDFNEPVITNTVFHTIGEDFLEITDNLLEQEDQPFELKVYPNPMKGSAALNLDIMQLIDGKIILFDTMGRKVFESNFEGNEIEFYKDQLPGGLYLFELFEGKQKLGAGKIIVAD